MAQNTPMIGNVSVTNSGNIACDVTLVTDGPENMKIELDSDSLSAMAIGESRIVSFTLTTDSLRGLQTVTFSGQAPPLTGESLTYGNDSATLEVMVSGDGESDGLTGLLEAWGLPAWSIAILALLIIGMLALVILQLRKTDSAISRG